MDDGLQIVQLHAIPGESVTHPTGMAGRFPTTGDVFPILTDHGKAKGQQPVGQRPLPVRRLLGDQPLALLIDLRIPGGIGKNRAPFFFSAPWSCRTSTAHPPVPLQRGGSIRHSTSRHSHRGPHPGGGEIDGKSSSTQRQRGAPFGKIDPNPGEKPQTFVKTESHKSTVILSDTPGTFTGLGQLPYSQRSLALAAALVCHCIL